MNAITDFPVAAKLVMDKTHERMVDKMGRRRQTITTKTRTWFLRTTTNLGDFLHAVETTSDKKLQTTITCLGVVRQVGAASEFYSETQTGFEKLVETLYLHLTEHKDGDLRLAMSDGDWPTLFARQYVEPDPDRRDRLDSLRLIAGRQDHGISGRERGHL